MKEGILVLLLLIYFLLSSERSLVVPQEEVRPQDTVSVIGGVAGSSKHGRKAAWKFVKDNWEELYNRYQGGFLISRLIKVQKVLTAPLSHLVCPSATVARRNTAVILISAFEKVEKINSLNMQVMLLLSNYLCGHPRRITTGLLTPFSSCVCSSPLTALLLTKWLLK